MPDPLASSVPDQETKKEVVGDVAGSAVTLLVTGVPASMVTSGSLAGVGPFAGIFIVDLIGGDGVVDIEDHTGDRW